MEPFLPRLDFELGLLGLLSNSAEQLEISEQQIKSSVMTEKHNVTRRSTLDLKQNHEAQQ